MTSKGILSTACAAICACALAAPARAGFLSYTLTAHLDIPTVQGLSLQFPQFDPSAGTLTGIGFRWEVSSTFQYSIFAPNGNGVSGQVLYSASTSMTSPNIHWVEGQQTPLESVTLAPSQTFNSPTYHLNAGRSDGLTSNYWTPYIGTGTVPADFQAVPSAVDNGPQGFNFIGDFTGAGARLNIGLVDISTTLTYSYTPAAAVPEPPSLGLVAQGGLMLAWIALRRRRRRPSSGAEQRTFCMKLV